MADLAATRVMHRQATSELDLVRRRAAAGGDGRHAYARAATAMGRAAVAKELAPQPADGVGELSRLQCADRMDRGLCA
jgi:hypothetical protein